VRREGQITNAECERSLKSKIDASAGEKRAELFNTELCKLLKKMKPLLLLVLAGIAQQGTPLQLLNAGGGRGAGLLLPRALNERQQSQMYAYVCANARGTQEWQNLQVDAGTLACDERDMFKTPFPAERPLPLLVHKHPYTLKSNGEEPRTILTWARQLASYAARKVASVAVQKSNFVAILAYD